MAVWERVSRKYTEEGVTSTLRAAPQFLRDRFRLQRRAVCRTAVGRITGDDILRRPDVLARARANGSVWTYRTDETVRIEYGGSQQLHPNLERMLGTYHSEAPLLCVVTDVTLVSSIPAVNGAGGFVLEGSDSRPYATRLLDLVSSPSNLRSLLLPPTDTRYEREFEEAFVLSAYPPPSYYHWMLDYLPKIEAYERYQRITGRQPEIVIPADPEPWRIEALEHVGCDTDSCISWRDGRQHVERLVVPYHRDRTPTPENFTPSMADLRWLRRRIFDNLEPSGREFSSRVYLSRRDATVRRVANDTEVERTLSKYGFESYALGELSFGEGVELFKQADVVVGPHGAGLVNLLFAEDVSVMELLPTDRVLGGFLCLSCQLDHDYYYQTAEPINGDIHVDIPELRETLALMGL